LMWHSSSRCGCSPRGVSWTTSASAQSTPTGAPPPPPRATAPCWTCASTRTARCSSRGLTTASLTPTTASSSCGATVTRPYACSTPSPAMSSASPISCMK
ncbi:hypothetical protein BAE44_0016170, partial [Dichanthelium oligosanthes]